MWAGKDRERRKVTKPDEVGWAIYEWWCNGRCEILVARRKQRLLTTTLLLCNEEREKNTEAVRKVDEKERNWLVFITSEVVTKRNSTTINAHSTQIFTFYHIFFLFFMFLYCNYYDYYCFYYVFIYMSWNKSF